jgi:hypothetical protein
MEQGNYPFDSLTKTYGEVNKWTKELASSLVERIKTRLKTDNAEKTATDAQIDMLLKMFYCPDVDFSNYLNIQIWTKVMYEGKEMRRRTTVEEFKEAVGKIKSVEINDFIQKFKVPYLNWLKGQATTQQRDLIRTLEHRLSDISKPRYVEPSVDMYGNITETVSKKDINWEGYRALDEYQLFQMSQELASKYINQLQIELADKTLYSYGVSDEQSDETLFYSAEADVDKVKKNDKLNIACTKLFVLADLPVEEDEFTVDMALELIEYINVNDMGTNAQIITCIDDCQEIMNALFIRN